MSGGLAGWLGYLDTELEPAIQAEILIETSRNEARITILELLILFIFGAIYGIYSEVFVALAWFCILTVGPLLIDSGVRRSAAKQLEGIGPKPMR
jgi:hypothetical protein